MAGPSFIMGDWYSRPLGGIKGDGYKNIHKINMK